MSEVVVLLADEIAEQIVYSEVTEHFEWNRESIEVDDEDEKGAEDRNK